MDRTVKLKYLDGWKIHEDGIKTPIYKYKHVSKTHYKRYYNTLCIVAGVGGAARNVLDYLCERMDNNNHVHSNANMRAQFIKDIAKWTGNELVYTDASVKKAIHTLVKKQLLLKTGTRGTLIVNPEFFFKAEEQQRLDKIQMLLEFSNGE
ncbi:replication/maintenance protein RepL [Zeaxanthinibacter sp. PT1]|uniref:replication/maintenance protein RepL n=1 Tax=Zeaxanthinibacter TaxID=561554 RepID=UPI00234A36B2|nr:replication/maintenance protein RepL [Zeaxanthinibacter sp. PT1]MDC6350755.1 replication/maintenance protein RepL [Zeaxanthinibacter sp. PT1]